MKRVLFLILIIFPGTFLYAQQKASVSFEKWLSLKSYSNPLISADGRTVAFTVTTTDWANNTYDSEIWMSRDGEAPVQLTRTNKNSSTNTRITPDSRFVSFVADRGEKNQLYIISVYGGEALQITKEEEGIGGYDWSPDGSKIAYTIAEVDSKQDKSIKERYGSFGVEGEEYKQNHLWLLNFDYDSVTMAGQLPCYVSKKDSALANDSKKNCFVLPVARRLTEGNFTVNGFAWRPDGKEIAFNRQSNPLINSGTSSDIVMVNITNREIKTLISNPAGDFLSRWSPDGTEFVYNSAINDSVSNFYKNNRLFIYNLATGNSRAIAGDIDENKSVIEWNTKGLFLSALEKTKPKIYLTETKTGKSKASPFPIDMPGSLSFSKGTDYIILAGRSYAGLSEIYLGKLNQPLKQLTNSSAQIANWNTPVNEVVSWISTDGTDIEGILIKPKNFDPMKKYPLLVVIHGGPTGIDFPDPTPTYVYPIMQWVEKGAIVLRVNYRGSAGYGEKFRSLNVRNLGVGDMWDVLSGVDHLISRGFVDSTRMGAMGWSQGGYISAFLTTNTNRFKAISVGAGISNWITYYVNTDITPFTRQYLQSTPWSDLDIYKKTSPMTNINKASTPTLIQHGEFDRRVPIPNAYELYRGLQDRGIPSKLIVYKGFGHGITKPKERLAAIWHNWQWFNKYIFGEEESLPAD